MTLSIRSRFLLTLIPLLGFMLILGGAGVAVLVRLGGRIDAILRENYDSIVAMERLNESLERIDSSFQLTMLGEETKASQQYRDNWAMYREKLRFEQGNITLPGERELVEELSRLTRRYQEQGDTFYARASGNSLRRRDYLSRSGLLETFVRIKGTVARIARINQDNMERASRQAKRTAALSLRWFGLGIAAAGLLGGFTTWSSLRAIVWPIKAVTESARGIRAGNLDQVVPYLSTDALGELAEAFNSMTTRLRQDRELAEERSRELSGTAEALRRELSEREQMEQSLRQMAAIVESSDDAIIGMSLDGIITSWNSGAERVFGHRAETAVGQRYTFLVPPEHADEFATHLEKVKQGGRTERVETVRRRKDGRPIAVSLSYFPVRDETGTLAGLASIARDISERKRAEEALRRAAAYNRRLIETSLDPLVTIGPDGKITDVNAAAEAATGFSRADLLGKDFADYFTDPPKARAGYQRVFGEGTVRDYPLEMRHRDGHCTTVLYNAAVYRDEVGHVVGVFAAARDITELKTSEDRAKRLAHLQGVVADLGQRVLRMFDASGDLLEQAVALVARTLDVEFCNVMELLPGAEELVLRAGVGWEKAQSGLATVRYDHSQAGFTVRSDRPVIVEDAATETRFVPLPRLLGETSVSSMSVVISTPEGPYGALGAHTKSRRTFTKDEVDFLQAVANVLGAAIQRNRARAQLERLARLQAVAADLGLRALKSKTTAEILEESVGLVAQTLGVEYCKVLELLPNGEALLLRWGVGWKEGLVGWATVGTGRDSQAGYTLSSDSPVVVEDLRSETRFSGPSLLHEHGVVSGVSVIIASSAGPYGVLGAHTTHRRKFTSDEVHFLQATANVLGSAIDRGRAERQLLRINRAFRAVTRCNQALIRATDEAALLRQICGIVVEEMGHRFCWVGYAEQDEARTVRPVAHAGFEDGYLATARMTWADTERGRGPTGTCIRSRELALIKDLAADPRFAPWWAEAQKRGYASCVAIPLIADDSILGALTIHASTTDAFGDDELALLSELAGDLAYGLMALRTRKERAESAAALEEKDRRIRLLLDSTAEAICGLDPQGRCTWANSASARLLGLTAPADLLGRRLHDVARHADSQGRHIPTEQCTVCCALEQGRPVHGDGEVMTRADGTTFPVEYWSHPVRRDSELLGAVISFLDITERKRAEEQVLTLNAELERRVAARTADLEAANTQLAAARALEVKIGFDIQQTLLLDPLPVDIPGLRVAALTVPSHQIDGDFYYFYKHDNGCVDVVVADVMGKGIPAALLAAAAKSHLLRALCHLLGTAGGGRLPEPREIVTLAAAEFVQHLIELESFVTICYVRIDRTRRRLDLVDCGHTGLIHWHAAARTCEAVHGDDLALGMRPGLIFDQHTVPFDAGDLLLLYSDGVTETRSPDGDFFGEDRLLECVAAPSRQDPEELVQALRRATFQFSGSETPSDDLTCVAIRIVEELLPAAHEELDLRSDLQELAHARAFVRSACRSVPGPPLDEKWIASLELAVTEACSNVVKHAYHGRTDQSIHVEADVFPDKVAIRLHYLGEPFDPSKVAPPRLDGSQESGFGIHLITHSVDDVRYYRDERGRNCIALVKSRHP
jgi:PAS domain S-box-containing protein